MHIKHLILRAPEGASAPAAPVSEEPGSDDLVASLMADVSPAPPAPPAAPTPPAEPTPTKAPDAPKDKPAAPAAVKPTAPAAPAAPTKPIDIDDPKVPASELRKHLKQLQADLHQTKTEKETTVSGLQSKLKQLEGKKYWSEDDEKNHAGLTQRLTALESDLYARDFTKSPEYQKQFVEKINAQAKDAMDLVKTLQTVDDAGNERAGAWQDITRLMGAENNAVRRRMAKELFGENFQDALDAVMPMVDTQKQSEAAVKSKSENYQTELKQRDEAMTAQQKQVADMVASHSASIAEKYPTIFNAGDDKDAEAALKKGFDFVEECSTKQEMDANERSVRIAMLRSWAGAFPRLVSDNGKLVSENAALKAELEKLRGSDPGAGGESGGGGSPAGKDDGGSDDLAREIEALERK